MMNRDETCLELNEIICRIVKKFWKQTYDNLLTQLSDIEQDNEITAFESFRKFRKGIYELAEENNLSCTTTLKHGGVYLSLIPYPIYIGIEKTDGEISISAPHLKAMYFQYNEYQSALQLIQNYINVDLQPLNEKISTAKEKYYLNTKSAEIIRTSIKSITAAILQKKGFSYEIKQNRLRSEINIKLNPEQLFRIEVYHKAFGEDSSLLVNQLNNPHEEFVEDKIDCYILKDKLSFSEENSETGRIYVSKN